MSVKQISVFLENKPGTLKEMTGVLAASTTSTCAPCPWRRPGISASRVIVDDDAYAPRTY